MQLLGLAATVPTSSAAYADISSVNSGCTNNGDNSPGGGELTQHTQNQSPAEHDHYDRINKRYAIS